MTAWLLFSEVRRAPRRLGLAALAVGLPLALLSATLFFIDVAVHSMTRVALEPVQVEMRVLAPSLDTDLASVGRRLSTVGGVRSVDRFAAADVVVGTPGSTARSTARLVAVDPAYLAHYRWVGVASGSLAGGALLNQELRSAAPFATATKVTIGLPGRPATLATLPVGGVVDLRQDRTWAAIPTGEVQGDVAAAPRVIVVDFRAFDRLLRPGLVAALGAGAPVLNPGLTNLPPVDLEVHVSVDHAAYPVDPASAVGWSAALRQRLEQTAGAPVVVADNAAEALIAARDDATNAKILFLLLGIPGVLVAVALGLAAESALAEARRREEALLRLRGATEGQLARLTAAQAGLAGVLGGLAGLVVAAAAVSAINRRWVWAEIPPGRLAVSVLLAVAAGAAIVAVRIRRVSRAGRRSDVVSDRHVLERGWTPRWRRMRLDLVAVGVGAAVLVVNALTGGLQGIPVEGPLLVLTFYVLIAPIALWIGLSLLAVRGLLAGLRRWARPDAGRPLPSWRGAAVRWLGRRPARTAVVLLLGMLAVAFGTEVIGFTATYDAARQADARAAFGADLHLTPRTAASAGTLAATAGVAATTPVRYVPSRVGPDRKTILAVDVATYPAAASMQPRMAAGEGIAALRRTPMGVLVAPEISFLFKVHPGDTLAVVVFPDNRQHSRNLTLRVVGVFRTVVPAEPIAELMISTQALPPDLLPEPDTYLARVAGGSQPGDVATRLRQGPVGRDFEVTTISAQDRPDQRSLTSLSLGGLGRLEAIGAGLVAALGVAVLGAFLVLERRREFAILRSLGADTPRLLTGPGLEGVIAIAGSVVLGVPLGLGLAVLAVRVLAFFFALPPPLLVLAPGPLGAFVLLVLVTSAVALAAALVAVTRVPSAAVLREQ